MINIYPFSLEMARSLRSREQLRGGRKEKNNRSNNRVFEMKKIKISLSWERVLSPNIDYHPTDPTRALASETNYRLLSNSLVIRMCMELWLLSLIT